MKNIKRGSKPVWKIIVTGVILICVLTVAVCFGYRMVKRQNALERDLEAVIQKTYLMQKYKNLQVSEDGKWFLIPEFRIRLPFAFMGEGGPWTFPPQYGFSFAWLQEEMPVVFNFDISGWEVFNEEYPGECLDPFIIRIDSDGAPPMNGTWESYANYKTFFETTLADGRKATLQERTTGPSDWCLRRFSESWGKDIRAHLSKIESY